MPYGIIKVDTITFTAGGVDTSIAISGLVQNPTFTGNVTATGTISGSTVKGTTVSGGTVSGDASNFGNLTAAVASGNTAKFGTTTITDANGARVAILGKYPETPLEIRQDTGNLHYSTTYLNASGLIGAIGTSSNDLTLNQIKTGGNFIVGTNSTERLRIDNAGRLLVGTSTSRTGLATFVNGTNNINADYQGSAASFVGAGIVGTATNAATKIGRAHV